MATSASAQTIIQSGKVVPGHAARIITNQTYGDAGGANGGPPGTGLTELNITSMLNNGMPMCINDKPITSAGGYHQICIGANAGDAYTVSANAFGGAAVLPLRFNINGNSYDFPGNGQGNVLGPNASPMNGIAVYNNTTGTLLRDATLGFSATGLMNSFTGQEFHDYATIAVTDTASNTLPSGTPKLDGLRVYHSFSQGEGTRNASFSVLEQTGPTPVTNNAYHFFTADFAWMKITQPDAGAGSYYAFGGLAEQFAGSTFQVKGAEFDTSIKAGATTTSNEGISIVLVNNHAHRGTNFDAAISIGADGTSTALWKNGLVFGDPQGIWPFAFDSVLISTVGATGGPGADAHDGLDLSGANFGGCAIKTKSICLSDTLPTGLALQRHFPSISLLDTGIATPFTNGGEMRITSLGTVPNSFEWQINTDPTGFFATIKSVFNVNADGGVNFLNRIYQPQSTPSSSTDTCRIGAIIWDGNFIYVCTNTNTFKRVALSSY